jgi:hypothetical protein
MRLYIYTITSHDDKPTTYEFTKFKEGAWHWDMRESAERALDMILNGSGGITVKAPDGRCDCCTDFRVEPRPQGGFAISCEHPFSSSTSDHV